MPETTAIPLATELADEGPEWVPCLVASLSDAKELLAACETAEIDAMLVPEASCGTGPCGCAPKMQVMVRADEVPRVGALLRNRWAAMVQREGGDSSLFGAMQIDPEGEPPCPACGHIAALVEGACAECGLVLA